MYGGVFVVRTKLAGVVMRVFVFERRSLVCILGVALTLVMPPSSLTAQSAVGNAAQLDIDVTKIVSPVSPTLYGLMTEEINHSYDGGLYAEMIQNRAFHTDWEGEPPWDLDSARECGC
jgi:hypothetical protein